MTPTSEPTQAAARLPLNCRILASWPHWRDADDWGRKQLTRDRLTPGEASALDRLTKNLRRLGDPSTWFFYPSRASAEEKLEPTVPGLLLAGLELSPNAIEEFVRVIGVNTVTRRQLLAAVLRKHVRQAATPPAPDDEPEAATAPLPQAAVSDTTETTPAAAPNVATPSVAIIETAPETDVFDPEHPCQRAPLEVSPMNGIANAPASNGTSPHAMPGETARITPPQPAGVREMVEIIVDRMQVDLTRELSQTVRTSIAHKAGLTEGQVKGAIEKIRKARGINTKTQPNGARVPRGRSAQRTAAPTAATVSPSPAPIREDAPLNSTVVAQERAKGLALTLAEELVSASHDTGTDRTALLLKASALLEKVL